MHVLEAAMAANLKPHPLRTARSRPAEWPDGSKAMMRLSAGLVAIGLFVLTLDAASMNASTVKRAAAEEARVP